MDPEMESETEKATEIDSVSNNNMGCLQGDEGQKFLSSKDYSEMAKELEPHSYTISAAFNIPGLKKIENHQDLAMLDGYKFGDAEDDQLQKVNLLFTLAKYNLSHSSIKQTIDEILIEELVKLSPESFAEFCRNMKLDTGSDLFSTFSEIFYGLGKFESVLIPYLIEAMKVDDPEDPEFVARLNVALYFGFEKSLYGIQKWLKLYETGEIDALGFLSSIPVQLLEPRIFRIIYSLYYSERDGSPDLERKFSEGLLALISTAESIPQLAEMLGANPYFSAYIADIKLQLQVHLGQAYPAEIFELSPEFEGERVYLFISLLCDKMHYEYAERLIDKADIDYSITLIRAYPKFFKYLMQNSPQKLINLATNAEETIFYHNFKNDLYVYMARHGMNNVLQVLPEIKDIKLNKGVCEEDLQIIYGCDLDNLVRVNVFVALCEHRLQTPEGRAWILEESANNPQWASLVKVKQYQFLAKTNYSLKNYVQENTELRTNRIYESLNDPIKFEKLKAVFEDLLEFINIFVFDPMTKHFFNALSPERLEILVSLPGISLDWAAEVACSSENWFFNLQAIVQAMIHRDGIEKVFQYMGLPYDISTESLDRTLVEVGERVDIFIHESLPRINIQSKLPYMTDYRKIIVLLAMKRYLR